MFWSISTGLGVINLLFYNLSSLFILLPSQFCAQLPFLVSTTNTDIVQRPLTSGGLTILDNRISPWPQMRLLIRQQCPPPLKNCLPGGHHDSIDTTVVHDPQNPTKTSCPPDFCDLLPPVNPLKMITTNPGIFDVASISSLFVALSQIALHPTSLFLTVLPGEVLNAAFNPYILFLMHQVVHPRHHLHIWYDGFRGCLLFRGSSSAVEADRFHLLFSVGFPIPYTYFSLL